MPPGFRLTKVIKIGSFLLARRCTSAGISYGPVSVCVCLSVSVTSRCSIETDGRIDIILARRLISTSVLKGNSVSTKIGLLPSGTFPRTLDIENLATLY